MYWCATASRGNPDRLVGAWSSVTRHVVDVHADHPGMYTKCLHQPIEDGEWLVPVSVYFYALTWLNLDRAEANRLVGWTKPDPAATTEHKLTPVATNRHSSGTEQHLDMDEEGRRRSERNRTPQTAAVGPPRLPATVATGTGSTSHGGSDDATMSQDVVAGQDSERSDTDTVGQSRYTRHHFLVSAL
ncbi:hypothetical protein HPB47_015480 [Ixodes persulcatus]|uniref:Uncharacterized protein n=1 Tax=Ixodes persulcatus TaxID=34615 RepID=A0AC60QTD1_IXOPE|nr:hypothetical protein HPB47_015480 [Ixodes persulcatus]